MPRRNSRGVWKYLVWIRPHTCLPQIERQQGHHRWQSTIGLRLSERVICSSIIVSDDRFLSTGRNVTRAGAETPTNRHRPMRNTDPKTDAWTDRVSFSQTARRTDMGEGTGTNKETCTANRYRRKPEHKQRPLHSETHARTGRSRRTDTHPRTSQKPVCTQAR